MNRLLRNIWYILSSKSLWISLVLFFVIIVGGVYLTLKYLNSYTHKNESITVPSLLKMTLPEAEEFVAGKSLRLKVIDSIYNPGLRPLEIFNQEPDSGSNVKEGRVLYLSVCSVKPDLKALPNVEDISLRNAISKLRNDGFLIGEKIYKPYLYPNTVLYVMKDGKKIEPGALYPKGQKFDLVVGNGLGRTIIETPGLSGSTVKEAEFILIGGYNLTVGSVHFDHSVVSKLDTAEALIYDQFPPRGRELRMGEFVDVWVTNRSNYRAVFDSLNFFNPERDIKMDSVDLDIKMN